MNAILKKIDEYAAALKKAGLWHTSRTPVGYIKKTKSHEQAKDNFIYEFYCYLRIVMDLSQNYALEYEAGAGDNKNKFPQGPAAKSGRPFFRLKDKNGNVVYQVCAGTEIKTIAGTKTNAPDISFQTPDADMDEPAADDVKLIIDAKYNRPTSDSDSFQEAQFDHFAMMIRNLNVESADQEKIQFGSLSTFKGNCILTNNKAFKADQAYLALHKVTEVEDFDEGKTFNVLTY